MPTINLLFTSAGRRVELLRAFRRAYEALNLDGNIIITDIDALAPTVHVADRVYMVPPLKNPKYIPKLIEICKRHDIHAIFPLIDPDIPVLAQNREIIEATGARLGVIPQSAVETVNDKWLTTQFFQRIGLPTPRSWLPSEIEPETATYPLFIKPRQGSAAKHTFKVNNARELAFFCDYVPDPIIQEFLPGTEITNDLTINLDGKVLAVVSRARLEVRSGEVSKGITIYDEKITEACKQIAAALPAIAPITVQCILKDGVPHFTEINARMGGGLPLGIAAGVDSPKLLLASLAGIPIEAPTSYQTALYITRYDAAFFLNEDEREEISRRRI
jgi:carbamoyl-phosphate synthase large subunit